MADSMSERRRYPCGWGLCVLLTSLAAGCSSPGGPSPVPTSVSNPSPSPVPPAPLQMSGRVLDENGAPLPGAVVEVDYASGGWVSTRTNDLGQYAFEFAAGASPGRVLGYVYSFRDGYEVNVQWVDIGPFPLVQDIRLRASRKILAGDSSTVSVQPTSSLCTDLEDLWAMTYRCEIVLIESGAGTLKVEARAASSGAAPLLYWYTSGNYAGVITRSAPGTISIPAKGGTYRVLVAIPEGTASQQFTVTTSLR
jgi:carboxypeptidase family protein